MTQGVAITLHPAAQERESDSDFLRPYVYRPPATIAPRQFLYGRHYQRKNVSATIAAPGTGKTTLAIAEALAMVTGQPLLGMTVTDRLRVGYWGEDPIDETERLVAAAVLHYGLDGKDLQSWLHLGSARDSTIVLGEVGRDGPTIDVAELERIERYIRSARLDVLMIDPFISSHRIPENDNGAMDLAAKAWVGIADRANISVGLIHHPRKGPGGDYEITVDDSRGGGALIAAARAVRMLNVMSESEADKAGLDERFAYIRSTNGKSNPSKRSSVATWFQLVGVPLGNGSLGLAGDEVAVVVPWQKPDAFAGVSALQTFKVQERIAAGEWRDSSQCSNWAGHAVAEVLGLTTTDKKAKARINEMLRTWLANGVLLIDRHKDKHGEERPFTIVGKWVTP